MYDDDAVRRALAIARKRRAYWLARIDITSRDFHSSMRHYGYWDRHVNRCLHLLPSLLIF